jgi:hypothetical protein
MKVRYDIDLHLPNNLLDLHSWNATCWVDQLNMVNVFSVLERDETIFCCQFLTFYACRFGLASKLEYCNSGGETGTCDLVVVGTIDRKGGLA